MTTKHSVTPWVAENLGDAIGIRAPRHGYAAHVNIAGTAERFKATQYANADFIVRAVNAHDGLLAALKDSESTLDAIFDMLHTGKGTKALTGESLDIARAAIAAAEPPDSSDATRIARRLASDLGVHPKAVTPSTVPIWLL